VFLIDSSTCVAILRNRLPGIQQKVRQAGIDEFAISSITAAELFHGVARSVEPSREMRKVQELLSALRSIDFGWNASVAYGLVRAHLERSGQLIGPLDLLIAAHALSEGATLVTQNVRVFSRVPGLTVENWTD
jgi:tRNA(fMet)-specific endonuclease VapC